MELIQDKKEHCHLAQMRNAVINFSNPKIIRKILATGVDVNHKFLDYPSNDSLQSSFSTALHLAATKRTVTNFKTLLEHGADVTIKDSDGLTALHRATSLSNNADESFKCSFIDLALFSQVTSNNSVNPSDNRGFTHFHAACTVNNVDAVEFFLVNGVSVDHAVNSDSSLFPGYTPLHFAARFASLETAEVLVKRGANVMLKDSRGMTPMHVLIERKIAMLELVEVKVMLDDDDSAQAVLKKIDENENILILLLNSMDVGADDIGVTNYHAICTLQKSSTAACLLENTLDFNARVNLDSPIWAGYTMLHFAAHCNIHIVQFFLGKGMSIQAKDANGVTPLDIFIKWCTIADLHSILSTDSLWSDITFSDGKTKLLDCILAMKSLSQFKAFISSVDEVNIVLPIDSPLWPGSNLLHLSVIFTARFAAKSDQQPRTEKVYREKLADCIFRDHIVKACLDYRVSIYARDVHGRTPLHLAFHLDKIKVVDMLLNCHHDDSNAVDDENLSILHIACAMRNQWMIDQWLTDSNIDVNVVYKGRVSLFNVKPGWTPLRVAIASGADACVVKMLLNHGADPYRVEENNFTSIHHLLLTDSVVDSNSKVLLSLRDLRESEAAVSFTHLHVASYFNNVQAVERLLELGTNIDAVSSLPRFENCTPLHLAMMNKCSEVVNVLLRRGADVFAKGPNGLIPLTKVLTSNKHARSLNTFVAVLRSNQLLRRRVKAELGLTILHVVCRSGHVDAIKDLLSKGADVNAKVRDDSPFWPGWTPLHVLVAMGIENVYQKKQFNDFQAMLEMLLERGAEVTNANIDGDTPMHFILKKFPCDSGYFIVTSLLSYQRDFTINPANKDGTTHFHAACWANNVEAAEKFLAWNHAGIDVNKPIGYFAHRHAGSTPLHLALNSNSKRYFGMESHMRMVALLLKYKPDLRAEDVYAYTPIHVAADCDPSCINLLQILIANGADINAQTIDGKTAFEIILRSKEVSVDEIEFFVKQRYRVNGCNPITDIGYLSIILNERVVNLRTEVLKALMDAPNIIAPDEMGRTATHNIVATNDLVISEHDYVELIDKLAKMGCDVNEQDKSGMTALHMALLFRNKEATTALLICGVDINIVDARGKTAFHYAFDPCTHCLTLCNTVHDYLLKVLVDHVHKLKLVGLYVSERNEQMKALALKNRWIKNLNMPTKVLLMDEKDKDIDRIVIGPRGWTLYDFLKEYGAVNNYYTLSQKDRTVIDRFFDTIDYHSFRDLKHMLKVQYRHAVARGPLVEPAIDSIKILFGLPDLCAVAIVGYLRNPDLKNLIKVADVVD